MVEDGKEDLINFNYLSFCFKAVIRVIIRVRAIITINGIGTLMLVLIKTLSFDPHISEQLPKPLPLRS